MMPVHTLVVQFYVCMPVMRSLNKRMYTLYAFAE